MAKSKKNSSHVSSVAKGQSLASSDGHIVEKENSILVTLKKILNIKVLGFIVAVATLAVTVWGIWFSESRVEKQKEKIIPEKLGLLFPDGSFRKKNSRPGELFLFSSVYAR